MYVSDEMDNFNRSMLTSVFIPSLLVAAYLGFALLSLAHDKILHFSAFGILTAEFYFLFEIRKPWRLTILVMTIGACISLEFVQNLVNPKRTFDYEDILYNTMGSLLAVIICIFAQSFRPGSHRIIDVELGEEDFVYVTLLEEPPRV